MKNKATFSESSTKAQPAGERIIALAGNPNVGKSTLFNRLTGMRQHTGNWPGKTVGSAYGLFGYAGRSYVLADIPGTYSLAARSAEEEHARDELLYGGADIVLVVCDATCLQRNMLLALQLMELFGNVIIAVNLMDEAERKGIEVNCELLESRLGVPVVPISAGTGCGIDALLEAIHHFRPARPLCLCSGCRVADSLTPLVEYFDAYRLALPSLWLAMRCIENERSMMKSLCEHLGLDTEDEEFAGALAESKKALAASGIEPSQMADLSSQTLNAAAEEHCRCVVLKKLERPDRDRKIDRILTHKIWGWPLMVGMLAVVLWITISGANYPSMLLSNLLFGFGETLRDFFAGLGLHEYINGMLVDGLYKTSAWVVAVMLPPMAIFFPLFTLLEDLGYLPRIAFNLDGYFKSSSACGKQSLTMCMGFGCNAVGVTGCRIIDSPRERLIAVMTNCFVPCNGRFPTLIALITVFFAGGGLLGGFAPAAVLTLFVILGVVMTLLASKLLSVTVLKGLPSSFTLELPPYRKPKLGQIIVRSIFDRTLFVLGRAVKIAAPAGLVIWLLANTAVGGSSLLGHLAAFLEYPAALLGLDGVILLAFIIGIPANEIVIPIILMCYQSGGSLMEYDSLLHLKGILVSNGWSTVTALCAIVFTLFHWPCATTLLTIKKETGSMKYTLLSAALPTLFGVAICVLINIAAKLLGF